MFVNPMLSLLGFSVWILASSLVTVGDYRWTMILSGRVPITSFAVDDGQRPAWYRRAIRAHANSVENLPLFIVAVLINGGGNTQLLAVAVLCMLVGGARILQTLAHVLLNLTSLGIWIRFLAFLTQIAAIATLYIVGITRSLDHETAL
jgi:uncharacterized MAPEG superfamily protein